MRRVVYDIEANGLLDETTIDYTSSPYKLRDSFVIHCLVAKDIDSGEVFKFVQDEVKTAFPQFTEQVSHWISHNGINYDHLALKLYLGLDYEIEPDTFMGKPVVIDDTMVMSKTLNPDRLGHSLEFFGGVLGFPKMDWRGEAVALGLIEANAPRGAEFAVYHPRMLDYCTIDVELTHQVFNYLKNEWGEWPWDEAYKTEKAVAEIITRQQHRGFKFNSEKARACVTFLDAEMENLRALVEPLIPPKKITKTAAKEFTPPAKQFKKDGSFSAHMENFLKKHDGVFNQATNTVTMFGKEWPLPLPAEPLVTEQRATLDDTTHLKEWLVTLGWEPTTFKEKDLTLDSKKKKLTPEKYAETVERYVEQTFAGAFWKHRCDHIGCRPESLRQRLLDHKLTKPLKVLTNPTLTVGQEKEIDPELLKLADKFSYAQEVSTYLTYKHRRNSILGGGVDPDDDEEASVGYLSAVREDGRIPTPADTCGAGTSRFKHRLVANIPRVSSPYGEEMRSLFGVEDDKLQIGYDFDSLEARIEAHYCFKYKGGPEYGESLIAEKPFDVHTLTAKKIALAIGQDFARQSAKPVKYGATYGAQAAKIAKIVGCSLELAEKIFDAFWDAAEPLKLLKEALTKYWENAGGKKYILGIDKRKVPTRSKHALLNSLFQSAGVICAKKAMILHDRMLREEGLIVDFFRQDWRSQTYCQQLIAYHRQNCGLVW